MRKSELVEAWFNRNVHRRVLVEVGTDYEIQPMNPQKLKHRGRICTVLDIEDDDKGFASAAVVRFHDNNRRGKVDLTDLLPRNGETPVPE